MGISRLNYFLQTACPQAIKKKDIHYHAKKSPGNTRNGKYTHRHGADETNPSFDAARRSRRHTNLAFSDGKKFYKIRR